MRQLSLAFAGMLLAMLLLEHLWPRKRRTQLRLLIVTPDMHRV